MIDFLTNPIFIGIISIIALGGTVCSICLGVKAIKKQKPRYLIRSKSIRESEFKNSQIKIKSEGNDIPRITISKLCFLNAGNETIEKKDIADNDPITIRINDDAEILDALIYYSKEANKVEYTLDKESRKNVSLSFDYLSRNDGFILKIFHTGKDSKELSISGTMKRGKQITKQKRVNHLVGSNNTKRKAHFFTLLIIVILLYIIIPVLSLINPTLITNRKPDTNFYISMSLMLTAGLFILVLAIVLLVKYSIPKDLYDHLVDD